MFLYKILITLFYPLIYIYLRRRMRRGKEDKLRFNERLGKPKAKRPNGKLIWIHGASVGEVLSVKQLISELKLKFPKYKILLTYGTVTAASIADKNYPDIIHQYSPVDVPFIINRFMKHWRPDAMIRIDSDFWPVQMDYLRRHKIPQILVNGSVTERAFKKYQKSRSFTKNMMDSINLAIAKSDHDAENLGKMGAGNVIVSDNMKYGNPPSADNKSERLAFEKWIGKRPTWHAAVLGEGEERIAIDVHKNILKKHKDALLIITPRHPSMRDELKKIAAMNSGSIACRSENKIPKSKTNIYVADTLGEMGIFYRSSNIVFMGRSMLSDMRGSSPLEAMQLGNVVIVGKNTSTFAELYNEMDDAKIIDRINDSDELTSRVMYYLDNPHEIAKQSKKISSFLAKKSHVLDNIINQIKPYLD